MTLRSLMSRLLGRGGQSTGQEGGTAPAPAAPAKGAALAPSPGVEAALRLFAAASGEGTFVLSPASVQMALGLVLAGARGGTEEELASIVGASGAASEAFFQAQRERLARWSKAVPGRTLALANGLFPAKTLPLVAGIEERFARDLGAKIEALDFEGAAEAGREHINAWTAGVTNGRIPEILGKGAIRSTTRLVLANALYFKGEWEEPFDASVTLSMPFTLASGERVSVPTMHQTASFGVLVSPEIEVVEMGYRGGDFAAAFVLPPPGASIASLEERLTAEVLAGALGELKKESVALALPKFTVDRGAVSLREPLARLGVTSIFDAATADLGGITSEPVALDDVVHRTFLEVNELGTEAAAATAAFGEQASLPSKRPRRFAVDRPFLFLLRDLRDGSLLFLGRVTDPRG